MRGGKRNGTAAIKNGQNTKAQNNNVPKITPQRVISVHTKLNPSLIAEKQCEEQKPIVETFFEIKTATEG